MLLTEESRFCFAVSAEFRLLKTLCEEFECCGQSFNTDQRMGAYDMLRSKAERIVSPTGILLHFGTSLTFPLPRVINVKFMLQPHQEYCITQYEELDFS